MKYPIGVVYAKEFLEIFIWLLATFYINSCRIESIAYGRLFQLLRSFEYSSKRCRSGVSGFAKYLLVSCSSLTDFQLGNSFPRSKIIDLNRLRGNRLGKPLKDVSLYFPCLQTALIDMIPFNFPLA